jgi:hypothetical protein
LGFVSRDGRRDYQPAQCRTDGGLSQGEKQGGCLNLWIGDAQSIEELELLLAQFFREKEEFLSRVEEGDGKAEIDVSLEVGSVTRYVTSVSFSPRLMSLAASVNVTLSVTAYPTDDE